MSCYELQNWSALLWYTWIFQVLCCYHTIGTTHCYWQTLKNTWKHTYRERKLKQGILVTVSYTESLNWRTWYTFFVQINVQPTVSKSSHTPCVEDKITVKDETSFCSVSKLVLPFHCVWSTKLYFVVIKESGVDFHQLTGATPDKYALNLMDSLFTDDEMRGHLFFKSARSKSTRELLPQDRVKKLLGMYTCARNACMCL